MASELDRLEAAFAASSDTELDRAEFAARLRALLDLVERPADTGADELGDDVTAEELFAILDGD